MDEIIFVTQLWFVVYLKKKLQHKFSIKNYFFRVLFFLGGGEEGGLIVTHDIYENADIPIAFFNL